MDAIVTASFLLVGWNTYSAIVVAKDTYTGKMPGPKSLGYSIAGLAGLSAFLLYFYGIKAEENPQLLAAEDDSWQGISLAGSVDEIDEMLGRKRKDAEDRDEDERMTRAEAEDLVQKVEKLMAPYVDRLEVCGSYRRGSQSPGDLDVIIIPKKGMTLPMIVQDINPAQVNWLGEQKTQIVIDGHKVDFRVSSTKGWGAALLYFTGPAGYNIGMRMRAKKLGMKLNEYGIFDRATDKYLGGETEDEIYQVLGKTPKTPEMRSKRAEQTFVRTKADTNKCSHCGVIGETFTVKEEHFCGPVCLHKYEGLAAEDSSPYSWLTEGECAMCNHDAKFVVEDLAVGTRGFCCEACYAVFVGLPVKEEGYYGLAAETLTLEAPRATYTDVGQQTFEKSYNIKAKKPLNAIVKDKMAGQLPSDDSRKYNWNRDFTISNMSKKESKLVQQYFSGLCMAHARFQTSNEGNDLTSVQNATANNAYMKSLREQEWLRAELKDYVAMQNMSDQEIVDYIAGTNNGMDFDGMLQLIRYCELMEGPYADIKMVATDRSPFEVNGGYGNVYYSSRNPYSFETLSMKNFGSWDGTDDTFKSRDGRRAGKVFTRMTKLRPYTTFPEITSDEDSYIEYQTDGGYTSSSNYFTMSPMVFANLSRRRNVDGYSATVGAGWRYNIKDWEGVKSAPYRYATMVRLPTMEELFQAYAKSPPISRADLASIYNKSKNLNSVAEAAKKKKEEEERALREKQSNLAAKNKAQADLEEINKSIAVLIKQKVTEARAAGLGDDEIYETLENTLYDIEDMVHDWEPDNYMAEEDQTFGCGSCGIGPLHTTTVEGLSFVLCPDCGLVKGKAGANDWNVDWSEGKPKIADPLFADLEWDDSEE